MRAACENVGLGMVLGGEPELLFDRVAYFHPIDISGENFAFPDGRAVSGPTGMLVYFSIVIDRETASGEVDKSAEVHRVLMAQPDDETILLPIDDSEEIPNGMLMLAEILAAMRVPITSHPRKWDVWAAFEHMHATGRLDSEQYMASATKPCDDRLLGLGYQPRHD